MEFRPGDEVKLGDSVLRFNTDTGSADGPAWIGQTWSGCELEAQWALLEFRSAASRACLETARKLAPTREPILLTGETGTGKEVLARWIHENSPRARKPLVVINCPALPDSLVESELFGVERGVATGVDARAGRFFEADGGTILLDEIGDLAPAAQAKMLRFLQDGCVDRPGRSAPLKADVRVLAATNADLPALVAAGRFRSDLYHRLAGFSIHLAPLRERREDLDALVHVFLARSGARISDEARAALEHYSFPGNIRELEILLRQAAILASRHEIGIADLPERVRPVGEHAGGRQSPPAGSPAEAGQSLYARIRDGASFWDLVHGPFLRRELGREIVDVVLDRAHAECGGSTRALARQLRVEDQYRKLVDFLRNHKFRA